MPYYLQHRRPLQAMIAKTFDLLKTTEFERRALVHEIWKSVNSKIFPTVGEELFYKLFFSIDGPINRLRVYYDDRKHLVGYMSCRAMQKSGAANNYSILRFTTNILSEYRGSSRTSSFIVQQLLKQYFAKIFTKTKVVLFFTANSPASYYGVARFARIIYPNPYGETPQEAQTLLKEIAKLSDVAMDKIDLEKFTTFYEGLEIKESARETAGWQQNSHPAVKLYLKNCPNYLNGQALLVMAPVDAANLIHCLFAWAYDCVMKGMGIRKSSYRA